MDARYLLDLDADVPESRSPRRESRTQQHLGGRAGDGTGDQAGDLHASRVEDPCLYEGSQHGDLVGNEGAGGHSTTSRPSSRSLSALTSAGGTRQAKTP